MSPERPLDLDTLRTEIDSGHLDTVIVAFPDMQGRLDRKSVV